MLTVPNAGPYKGAGKPLDVSAPDQLDFQTLADGTRGVVSGCHMAASSGSVSMDSTEGPNIVYVGGELRHLPDSASLGLSLSAGQDRFDLVVYDASDNGLKVLLGTPANSPVFPPLTDDQVLLYALFVPAGTDVNATDPDFFVDKRNILSKNFMGSVLDDRAPFIRNSRGLSDVPYEVAGDGTTTWTDVSLRRSASRKLSTNGSLEVGIDLTVLRNLLVSGTVAAQGRLSGSNLMQGDGAPTDDIGELAAVYQQLDTGALWVKGINHWMRLVGDVGADDGTSSGVPPGTLIESFLPPGDSYLAGFLPLDGSTYSGSDPQLGRLWSLATGPGARAPFTNWLVSANSALRLPDMTLRVPLQDPGRNLGEAGGSMSRVISTAQLPEHRHFGGAGSTEAAGAHRHDISLSTAGGHQHVLSGGRHTHHVADGGHAHGGSAWAGSAMIALVWGGENKIDGPFNDGSHTYSVDAVPGTAPAATGVQVTADQSDHGHAVSVEGGHAHTAAASDHLGHQHQLPPESPVGSGAPIDITPAHVIIRYYVKT